MDLGRLVRLVVQALCQAGSAQGVLAQQAPEVHLNGVLQQDVVLLCDQDVMNEAESAALHE